MPTKCVFIRHAKPESEWMGDDYNKPLSEEGRDTLQTLDALLKKEKLQADLVFTSPLVRAAQTATIVANGAPISKEPALGSLFEDDRVLDIIKQNESATLFFVGHAPSLGDFASRLVGEDVLPQGLSKATAVVVSFEDTIGYGEGAFVGLLKG